MALADILNLNLNIGSGFFVLAIDIGKGRSFADLLAITVSLGPVLDMTAGARARIENMLDTVREADGLTFEYEGD